MRTIAAVSTLCLALAAFTAAYAQAQEAPAKPESPLVSPAHWRGGEEGDGWRKGGKHHRKGEDRRGGGGRDGSVMRERMEAFDLDKDGKVTQAEIDRVRQDVMTKYDADKNGSLSLSEFQAFWADQMRERMVRAFQRNDRDGDGQVTPEEFNRRFANMVERFDRDGDGSLSANDRRGHRRGPPPAAPTDETPATPPAAPQPPAQP